MKTEAVKNCRRTLTSRDVMSFFALAGYYRRFVNEFASLASSLTSLTQKECEILVVEHM